MIIILLSISLFQDIDEYAVFAECLTKMTSVMKLKYMEVLIITDHKFILSLQQWWLGRIILHNQLIYNEIESKLVEYILRQSPLFKKKGSHFFRNLKKVSYTNLMDH